MTTYKIMRFFKDENKPAKEMYRGLTLEEAKEHCQRKDTHGEDWFDGWTEE